MKEIFIKGKIITLILASFLFAVLALPGTSINAMAKNSTIETKAKNSDVLKNKRILFVGDSRTVDMFSAKKTQIRGKVYNNIRVYCKDAGNYSFLVWALNDANIKKYDVIVTWMGANDRGDFSRYQKLYNKLRRKGKKLIVCTVGYSDTEKLTDYGDLNYYNNWIMQDFNRSLKSWAKKNKVDTIDLYAYTLKNVATDGDDGIHYGPKPTTKIWKYVLKKLKKNLKQ